MADDNKMGMSYCSKFINRMEKAKYGSTNLIDQNINKYLISSNNEHFSKETPKVQKNMKSKTDINNIIKKTLTDFLFKEELTDTESLPELLNNNAKEFVSKIVKDSKIKDVTDIDKNKNVFIISDISSTISNDSWINFDEIEDDECDSSTNFSKIIKGELLNLDVGAQGKKRWFKNILKKSKENAPINKTKTIFKRNARKQEATENFLTSHDEARFMPTYRPTEDKRNCISISIEDDHPNVHVTSVQLSTPESHKQRIQTSSKTKNTSNKPRNAGLKRMESNIEIKASGGNIGINVKRRLVKEEKMREKLQKPYIVVQAPHSEEDVDEEERKNRFKEPVNDSLCHLEQDMIDTLMVGIGEKKEDLRYLRMRF